MRQVTSQDLNCCCYSSGYLIPASQLPSILIIAPYFVD